MAVHDWNGNGKIDRQDDIIEYQVYKECMKNASGRKSGGVRSSGSGGEMSWFETVVSLVVGFILEGLVFVAIGVDISTVPAILIIILWIVFTVIAVVILTLLRFF